MSPGAISGPMLSSVLARDGLVDLALARAEPAAVAGHAVQAIVNPLRDAEELRVALNHEPAGIDSAPRPYAIRERSISATPPPFAVELMFHTTRPAKRSRP